MRFITRQIFTLLVIVLFIGGLHAVDYPEPAKCESDEDCLKGQAKCIRRECHCTGKYAFGDGKTKCEKWKQCLIDMCKVKGGEGFKNSHCLASPSSGKRSCKCDNGHFGRPNFPRCMRNSGASTKHCSSNKDCHIKHGMCFEGKCHCVGMFAGDGVNCRKAKPCASNHKCPDSHAVCYMDPVSPFNAICRCDIREGFKRSKDGTRCIECSSDSDCKQAYSTCYKGTCKCKDELIRDGKTCKPAPLHECKEDKDCDSRAKCEEGKCICQGNTTGNGKYCRDSLQCSPDYHCGSGGTCLVDPLFPKKAKCRCNKGYHSTKDGGCAECLISKDCNVTYSMCDNGTCKCKDELIKEGKTCKHAPLHLCDEEHKCHEKARCHMGKCYCQRNSTGNGIFCRDSLPCPKEHKCGNHSVCVVDPLFPDKPDCKCDLNYKKSADGKTCEEMTECFKKGIVCTNDTICGKDSDGSYNCVCHKGFEMTAVGGNKTCQDIDECKHTNSCVANSTCHNLKGSYKCVCDHGFKINATKQSCEAVGPHKAPISSRSRQHPPGQWGADVSRSPCMNGHVIFLLFGLLCYQAFT
ncbi:uncharacterized protein LOC144656204 isoform X2 [Oculina patagonica]